SSLSTVEAPFITRDTVAEETPAVRAASMLVGRCGLGGVMAAASGTGLGGRSGTPRSSKILTFPARGAGKGGPVAALTPRSRRHRTGARSPPGDGTGRPWRSGPG